MKSGLFVACMLAMAAALPAKADGWMRDAQPALIEVHYTRTEVTDTTRRSTDFYKEETMLRIGRDMSRYCSVPKYYDDSLRHFNSALYWERERIAFENSRDQDPRVRDMEGLARRGRYSDCIYKNYPKGKITVTSYFDMEDWRYDED